MDEAAAGDDRRSDSGEEERRRVRNISEILQELARAPDRAPCDPALHPGQVIGRFELIREVGHGGFGVVFEARDRELGRVVAFKALHVGSHRRDAEREELLRREAEAIAHLQHPNIVTLFDSGRMEAGPYLILELLHGEPLSSRLARGPLSVPEALHVAVAVTSALTHAHRAGVLHRDLKPANVFLCHDGAVKVLDFGLAHVFGTTGPAYAGTAGYMAPEQMRGEPEDARTDVYAVGVLLREMITGERPRASHDGSGPLPSRAAELPPRVADVVRRATQPTPTLRFRDASELLEELVDLERGVTARPRRAVRPRAVAMVAIGIGLTLSALGWFGWRFSERRVVVCVADFRNDTDDADLEGLSGMLITSLEQSRRIAVLTRTRAMDVLRRAVPQAPPHLDAAAAGEVARIAGASALLLGSVRRDDRALAIELRALRPRDGKELFATLHESAAREADVPAAIDRLSHAARLALGERDLDLRNAEVPIAVALTPNLEAYRHFVLGEQCAARPIYGQDCGVEFRRAVERDPTFGAAHYQVALWYEGDRVALQRAVEYAEHAPEKERLFIRALAAHVDGNDDEALALYSRITSRWPNEKRAWFEAGDILRHRDRFEAAIPWFQRAIELDPEYGWALGHFVEALGISRRSAYLQTWVDRWEQSPRPATLHALSLAYGWLGDTTRSVDAARRAALLGAGLLATEDLLAAKVYGGEYDEAERDSEILARPESEVRPIGFYALAAIAAYEGRPRAGVARLDALAAASPNIDRVDRDYHALRADYLVGMGDARAVWREVEAARAVDPQGAAEHAAGLAWLGDLPHASELARGLRPGSVQARAYEAVAAYRRGDTQGALERLRAVARQAPLSAWRVGAIFLYADLAGQAGRDGEVVSAVRTFHQLYMPRLMWRSWAYPRSLLMLARSSERLGKIADACAALDRLATAWRRAEPDQPFVTESRALRTRLCHASR